MNAPHFGRPGLVARREPERRPPDGAGIINGLLISTALWGLVVLGLVALGKCGS